MEHHSDKYALAELELESTLGGEGIEDNARKVPLIDMSNFEQRRAEITEQLWAAATDIGFFQLQNHGIPIAQIQSAFAMAEQFFALPESTKARFPLVKGTNAGWEFMQQVRPSTGTADRKESYQVTLPRMAGLWPSDEELAGFKALMLEFEHKSWQLGMQVLSCFADKLGFARDFFTKAHDPHQPTYQSTLRLLHYFPTSISQAEQGKIWRAGAHTDFDCLTLVYQREGQGGLQLCPGKEVDAFAWTSVPPREDLVTCNIGDMLMRWSDDQLKSTLHRVRMPRADEHQGSRYSMAFFCQANCDVMIQGPGRKYPPISAEDYLKLRIAANFAGQVDA